MPVTQSTYQKLVLEDPDGFAGAGEAAKDLLGGRDVDPPGAAGKDQADEIGALFGSRDSVGRGGDPADLDFQRSLS